MPSQLPNDKVTRRFELKLTIPWEPTTFIFRGYNPYVGGVKPSWISWFWGPRVGGIRIPVFLVRKPRYQAISTIAARRQQHICKSQACLALGS